MLLSRLRISVLDTVPVASGSTTRTALQQSVELAEFAEKLGYARYWVAEHHNLAGFASTSPAVLVGHIADRTSNIRVGAGGVMLPNHAPLVVAEQFGTLEALHPGRIDLGIGRAPGTDPVTALALRRVQNVDADYFAEQVAELVKYMNDPGKIAAYVAVENRPALWHLGSGMESARLAGSLGLPYAFAHHINPGATIEAIEVYRSSFRPSPELQEPYVIISAHVLCADTEADAERLSADMGLSIARVVLGQADRLFPSSEEVAGHTFTEEEKGIIESKISPQIFGDREIVHEKMRTLLEQTEPDELMALTLAHDRNDRFRSYELLADIVGIAGHPSGRRGEPRPA